MVAVRTLLNLRRTHARGAGQARPACRAAALAMLEARAVGPLRRQEMFLFSAVPPPLRFGKTETGAGLDTLQTTTTPDLM